LWSEPLKLYEFRAGEDEDEDEAEADLDSNDP
jgi:hypothetical protein